jgi:hypothetical protein
MYPGLKSRERCREATHGNSDYAGSSAVPAKLSTGSMEPAIRELSGNSAPLNGIGLSFLQTF